MFTLQQVVPWGRSFDEYCRMFALTPADLSRRILGCGDGPAGFNAVATSRGTTVTSCDPIYRWDRGTIRARIDATRDQILDETRRNQHRFVWDAIESVEELGRLRMTAMQAFLDDYETGKTEGRYVEGALPSLPFADGSFDLALCSHLLFLYSVHLDGTFHRNAIGELCRVAEEVRIFPLLTLDGRLSPYVENVHRTLDGNGHQVTTETVAYEFQRGGNQMMRITRTAPAVDTPRRPRRTGPADRRSVR